MSFSLVLLTQTTDIATEVVHFLSERYQYAGTTGEDYVYRNRKTKVPEKPSLNSFYEQQHEQGVVTTSDNSQGQELSSQPTNINRQSKVKETKVKETKGNNSSSTTEKNTPDAPNNISNVNAHEFYQNNFGVESPTIMLLPLKVA